MYFISEVAEFARRKGSKDKQKRKARVTKIVGTLAAGAGLGAAGGYGISRKVNSPLGKTLAIAGGYAVGVNAGARIAKRNDMRDNPKDYSYANQKKNILKVARKSNFSPEVTASLLERAKKDDAQMRKMLANRKKK